MKKPNMRQYSEHVRIETDKHKQNKSGRQSPLFNKNTYKSDWQPDKRAETRMEMMERSLIQDLMKNINQKGREVKVGDMVASKGDQRGNAIKGDHFEMSEPYVNRVRKLGGHLQDLKIQNGDYFDHISGRCICARCTCGMHHCSARTQLMMDQKAFPKSHYQQEYIDKDLTKAHNPKCQCPMDNLLLQRNIPLESMTTNKQYYLGKTQERTAAIPKKEDNLKLSQMPIEHQTAYRDAHTPKKANPVKQFIQPDNLETIKNLPFQSKTENRSQFSPAKIAHYSPQYSAKPDLYSSQFQIGTDSKSPHFYQSTYNQYHSPLRKEDDVQQIANEIKNKFKQQSVQNGQGLHMPNTTQRDHYQTNNVHVCPIILERAQARSQINSKQMPPSNSSSRSKNRNRSLHNPHLPEI